MRTQIIRDRVYDYHYTIGRVGISGAAFSFPIRSCVGQNNNLYVLSRGYEIVPNVPWNQTGAGSRISKIDMGEKPGQETLLMEIGQYGDGNGQFIWPAGLSLDASENIYVTDEWLNTVIVFSQEGKFLRRWGTPGNGPGELNGPSGIAIDNDQNILVVNSNNHLVQKFDLEGKYLGGFGGFGTEIGQLNCPWGISIDPEGYIYIADYKNHRIQKFDPSGTAICTFGSYGSNRGKMNLPTEVAIDSDGDLYIADWANNRVQLFSRDGDFLASFIGDSQEMSNWGQMVIQGNPDVLKRRREVDSLEPEWRLCLPMGVTFDKKRNWLIVSDTQRNRLQIYKKVTGYMEPQRNL